MGKRGQGTTGLLCPKTEEEWLAMMTQVWFWLWCEWPWWPRSDDDDWGGDGRDRFDDQGEYVWTMMTQVWWWGMRMAIHGILGQVGGHVVDHDDPGLALLVMWVTIMTQGQGSGYEYVVQAVMLMTIWLTHSLHNVVVSRPNLPRLGCW